MIWNIQVENHSGTGRNVTDRLLSIVMLGSKAIDVLLESKWAAKSGKMDPLLTNRSACEAYLER